MPHACVRGQSPSQSGGGGRGVRGVLAGETDFESM